MPGDSLAGAGIDDERPRSHVRRYSATHYVACREEGGMSDVDIVDEAFAVATDGAELPGDTV